MTTVKGTCKGCGRILILELEDKISRHEAPLCEAYERVIAGLDKTLLPAVEVGEDGWPVHGKGS
jgi:hypothetical protein